MNDQQIAWLCGMAVGVVFGALLGMLPFPWGFVGFLTWFVVLLGYIYDLSRRA